MIDYAALVWQPFYEIENKDLLLQAYQEVFGIELCRTCPGSHKRAWVDLRAKLKSNDLIETTMSKSKCKYQFKPEYAGMEIHKVGVSFPITNATLTDEIAEEFLLKSEVYKDWIEPVAKEKTTKN